MNLNSIVLKFSIPAVFAFGVLACPAAHADPLPPLTFTLMPAGQTTNPGGMLYYSGTLSNTTNSEVFLNGDTPSFGNPMAGLSIDDSPFFSNGPTSLGAMGSGSDTYTGDFFDVTVDPSVQPGTYYGSFTITGGSDGSAQDTVASTDFSVTVQPAPVPEASSMVSLGVLLALGLGRVLLAKKKAHSQAL